MVLFYDIFSWLMQLTYHSQWAYFMAYFHTLILLNSYHCKWACLMIYFIDSCDWHIIHSQWACFMKYFYRLMWLIYHSQWACFIFFHRHMWLKSYHSQWAWFMPYFHRLMWLIYRSQWACFVFFHRHMWLKSYHSQWAWFMPYFHRLMWLIYQSQWACFMTYLHKGMQLVSDFIDSCDWHIINEPVLWNIFTGSCDKYHSQWTCFMAYFDSLQWLMVIFCFFVLILYVPVNIFNHLRTGLPGLNQYYASDKVSCSRTQHNDSTGSESQICNPLILILRLYQLSHCALQWYWYHTLMLGLILIQMVFKCYQQTTLAGKDLTWWISY